MSKQQWHLNEDSLFEGCTLQEVLVIDTSTVDTSKYRYSKTVLNGKVYMLVHEEALFNGDEFYHKGELTTIQLLEYHVAMLKEM